VFDYLPLRRQLAIAIDEEIDYSLLHSYTAYRFGFRAVAASTYAIADEYLRHADSTGSVNQAYPSDEQLGPYEHPPSRQVYLAFEDLHLNFPDSSRRGLSQLYEERHPNRSTGKYSDGRCVDWPRLESAKYRVFVSAGLKPPGERERMRKNVRYLRKQQALGRRVTHVSKPHAGMFRLWEHAGLRQGLKQGLALEFKWPPPAMLAHDAYGHSAPGMMLLIANALIGRAKRLEKDDLPGIEPALRGAVLAGDAVELLGGRTGTVSVDALRMKHRFEIRAECAFSGVEHHMEVRARSIEVRKTIGWLSGSVGRPQRATFADNSELEVMLDLGKILSDAGRFDEGLHCLNRVRHLHNTLWMRKHPGRYLMWPVLRYLELLLGSFALFVVIVVMWVFALGVGYNAAAGYSNMSHGLMDSVTSFFSIGSPVHPLTFNAPAHPDVYGWVVAVAVVSGFVHLGVFVSHMYTIVSRRS
jgi:hypothetical protein